MILATVLALGSSLAPPTMEHAAAAPTAPSKAALKTTVKVDKKSTLNFLPVNYGSKKRVVVAKFNKGHKGRPVSLQYKSGKNWKHAASGTMSSNGRVTFTVKSVKNATYRAVADTHRVKKKSLTPSSTVTVNPATQWRRTFRDSFSGTKLKDSWTTPDPFYAGGRLCASPDPKMAKVKDGKLVASVRRLNPTNTADKKKIVKVKKAAKAEQKRRKDASLKAAKKVKGTAKKDAVAAAKAMKVDGCPNGVFANAYIDTRASFSQGSGILAARVKFPKAQGMHGAVWMQTMRSAQLKPLGAELDMIESFGYGKGITNIVHLDEKGNGVHQRTGGYIRKDLTSDPTWWDKYHVYSLEWTSSQFIFRVDGVETSRVSKKAVKGDKYAVLISLLSSDWEIPLLTNPIMPKKTPGVKKAKLSKDKMYVDWIEVWKRA